MTEPETPPHQSQVQTVPPSPIQPKKVGNPGKGCSRDEYAQRIDTAIALLGNGYRPSQVARRIAKNYDLSIRMAEIYISHARKQMLQHSGKSREELISEAYGLYCLILQDPNSPPRVMLEAERAIVKLFGLDQPQQFRIGGAMDVKPIIEVRYTHELDRLAPQPRP